MLLCASTKADQFVANPYRSRLRYGHTYEFCLRIRLTASYLHQFRMTALLCTRHNIYLKINTSFSITFILLLFFALSLRAQSDTRTISREEYIRTYKPLAISKMREFGIPASIALAQALIESNNGNSVLARSANNHFGIKCHEWTGESFRWDDDEKQECFRKYASVEDSYYDHSLFLTRRPRYAGLFGLEITDYQAWAHGLRRAGYATNPNYPQMLIRVIEENRLYELDYDALHEPVLADAPLDEEIQVHFQDVQFTEVGPAINGRKLYLNNRRLLVIARSDDTYFKVANDFGLSLARICHINDTEPGRQLQAGAPVYIEHKRRRSRIPAHMTQPKETMHEIAQQFGVRLGSLYRLNAMLPGTQPEPGQEIRLR